VGLGSGIGVNVGVEVASAWARAVRSKGTIVGVGAAAFTLAQAGSIKRVTSRLVIKNRIIEVSSQVF
jgi:hypothetical protein